MIKKLIFLLLIGCTLNVSAQKYITKSGKIHFLSDTPMEKIEATNDKATSVLDATTGNIEWAVLIKGFHFDRALMEEHFNENYMESSKFPKAKFKGKITNMTGIDFSKNGTYNTKISGDLEIHGVTNTVSTDAVFVVKNGVITASSKFKIEVVDYKIEIPSVVKEKVAKYVAIDVSTEYTPYQ